MKLQIVNTKKFIRMLFIIVIIGGIVLFIGLKNTYSKGEIKYREEYIGYTSISIGLGRIIGYILMLIVSFTTDIIYFKILLAAVTLFAPIYCYLIVKSLKD